MVRPDARRVGPGMTEIIVWVDELTLEEVESHPAPVRWAIFSALGWIVRDRRWLPGPPRRSRDRVWS